MKFPLPTRKEIALWQAHDSDAAARSYGERCAKAKIPNEMFDAFDRAYTLGVFAGQIEDEQYKLGFKLQHGKRKKKK